MNEVSQLHALVHGHVQGVYFRDFTRSHAVRLGLTGWVRNLQDGYTVEVLAQGEKQALEKLLTILHKGHRRLRLMAWMWSGGSRARASVTRPSECQDSLPHPSEPLAEARVLHSSEKFMA